jgi:hypothetical protein
MALKAIEQSRVKAFSLSLIRNTQGGIFISEGIALTASTKCLQAHLFVDSGVFIVSPTACRAECVDRVVASPLVH